MILMKTTLRLLSILSAFIAFAAHASNAPSEILEGTKGMTCPDAVPGTTLVLTENAFGLLRAKNWDGTTTFAAAGTVFGEGRAVYFGHPGFLERGKTDDDSVRFMQNVVRWAVKGKENPKIGVRKNANVARTFREVYGIEVEVFDSREFGGYDLIIANNFTPATAPLYVDFVQKGGALIGAGLGWAWKQYNPNGSFASEFGDNLAFAPMGILQGDNGCTVVKDGFYTADPNAVPRGTLVNEALDIAAAESYADKTERKQVTTMLSQAAAALPPTLPPELVERFASFASNPKANKVPAARTPVEPEDIFARLAILARKAQYESDPFKAWPADPAAATYPRLVKPGTPKIERTVDVDASIPRWHSTGVFAVAGEPVTVEIPADKTGLGLRLRIGTTDDDLSTLSEGWRRFPKVTTEVPLKNAATTVTSPFGGLVYVVVPEKASGTFPATIKGGVMAPWFKLGRDTNEKFIEECRTSGAPQAEIEGNEFIVTADIEGGVQADAKWVAEYWDKVLGDDWWLSGRKGKRAYPERFCSDVQLIAGWLHNGYPMMCHTDLTTHYDVSINKEMLEKGGGWGIYHEIGHNHQFPDWTPPGMGEVTCNIFTLLAINRTSGCDYRANGFETARRSSAAKVRRWVGSGKNYKKVKEDYFLALEFYARLIDVFGWDVLHNTFAHYQEPDFVHPKGETEQWDTFARLLSKEGNANVAEVMALWNMPISEDTLKACSVYPKAADALFADLTLEPYVSPEADLVEGDYMGVCLTGKKIGTIELYKTRKDIPGGEKSNRWKGDWMLLRRVEAGTYKLGSHDRQREVEFSRPYYIGIYEVTRQQWFNVVGEWKGSVGTGAGYQGYKPANDVSNVSARGGAEDGVCWPETGHKVSGRSFFGKLRELTGFRAEFDLPTEAQWETACRSGSTNTWNNGEKSDGYKEMRPWSKNELECDHVLDKLGRYYGNGSEKDGPAVVGSYEPNLWGIYDMHGNVWEQLLDYLVWNAKDTPGSCGKDPAGRPTEAGKDDKRAIIGGGFWNDFYGKPGFCKPGEKGLAAFFPPGSASGAIGIRVCVDGALTKEPSSAPWGEKLSPEALKARNEIVDGVGGVNPDALPGQVYVLGSDAFPVLAARMWDNQPACWGAAAFCGKGRVFHLSVEDASKGNPEFEKLVGNIRSWLKNGAWFGGCKEVNGADVKPEDIPGLVEYVKNGGGLLVTGRAWPWWQTELEAKGAASAKDWPGNGLLQEFGLMSGRFVVRSDSGDGFYSARIGCLAGAAEAQPDAFETQKLPAATEPIPTPELVSDNATRVPNGATIAFLGDSITRLGNDKGSWIDQVTNGLAQAGVKNVDKCPAGWDGQNAGDMAGRVGGLVGNPDVKVMTLSCGVNDIWGFDWNRGVELAEYKRHVRAIYDRAAREGVLVVAMTPTLMRENPNNDYNRLLDQFADFIREEAALRNLPLADCRKAELEFLKGFKPDTGLHFSMDGVHPVKAGNEIIAREVLRALGVSQ